MIIIDANAILRYILCDNEDMANHVEELLEHNVVCIKHEVLAEVVYVLTRVYSLPRVEVQSVVMQFLELDNVVTDERAVVARAMESFCADGLDFVDSMLYAYCVIKNAEIFTFDKKLLSKVRNFKNGNAQ